MVSEAAIAFGGVAAKAVMAPKTAASLIGQPLEEKTLLAALSALSEDVQIGANAPGKAKRKPWSYPDAILKAVKMFSFGRSFGFHLARPVDG